jgi:hypothetical protein
MRHLHRAYCEGELSHDDTETILTRASYHLVVHEKRGGGRVSGNFARQPGPLVFRRQRRQWTKLPLICRLGVRGPQMLNDV